MVTTIDGSFSTETSVPLIAPQTSPTLMPTATSPGAPIPIWAAAPMAVEASAMIAATERSISPTMISIAMAKAIIAFSVKLNVASDRFQALRK
ncbi:hypothetical protein D3C73_795630 [compost metagenome]